MERIVIEALRNHVAARLRAAQLEGSEDAQTWSALATADDPTLVSKLIDRVVVGQNQVQMHLVPAGACAGSDPAQVLARDVQSNGHDRNPDLISVEWTRPGVRRRRDIIIPDQASNGTRPIRDQARANLLGSMARARSWLKQLQDGSATSIEQIASIHGLSERSVRLTINLAFLSPTIVRAVVDGSLPRNIGSVRLAELPMNWDEQHQTIGVRMN